MLINALIGQVPISKIHISGNATYRPLAHGPPSKKLTLPQGLTASTRQINDRAQRRIRVNTEPHCLALGKRKPRSYRWAEALLTSSLTEAVKTETSSA